MKKQKLLFFPFLLGLGIGLLSCNFGGSNGNNQTFQNVPAVIDWRMDMGTVMCTPWGYIAAPELVDVNAGDCIYIYQFMLDYDNQPSDTYYTATAIDKDIVDQSYLEPNDTVNVGDYTLPISNLSPMVDEFFMGRMFVGMSCKDKNPSLRLVYNSKEDDANGVKNFYLLAKPSSGSGSSSDVSTIHAFNLLSYIQYNGRDTTKTFKGSTDTYDFNYIKVNLKYLSSMTTDNKPVYTTYSNPLEIYVFKNNP